MSHVYGKMAGLSVLSALTMGILHTKPSGFHQTACESNGKWVETLLKLVVQARSALQRLLMWKLRDEQFDLRGERRILQRHDSTHAQPRARTCQLSVGRTPQIVRARRRITLKRRACVMRHWAYQISLCIVRACVHESAPVGQLFVAIPRLLVDVLPPREHHVEIPEAPGRVAEQRQPHERQHERALRLRQRSLRIVSACNTNTHQVTAIDQTARPAGWHLRLP
jgi:hypothetical protein